MNNKSMKKIQTRQHFGIRKLSIGIASVLLGTTVLFVDNKTVQASTDDDSQTPPTDQNAPVSKEKTGKSVQLSAKPNTTDPKTYQRSLGVNKTAPADNKDGAITKQDALKILGYTGKELSDEQLAKLGITKDTYLKDGIKYKAVGKVSFTVENTDKPDKTYVFDATQLEPLHHADGSMYSNEELDIANFRLAFTKYHIGSCERLYQYAPIIKGGTIYINKNHVLNSDDALRGLPEKTENTYQKVNWDKNVESKTNISEAGTYDAAVSVLYKSQLGQSVGVKVVVVDPQGIRKEAFVGDSISTDAKDYLTYTPTTFTPKSIEWAKGVSAPSTAKAGTFTKQIVITYPDGNKGMALATIIVANPRKTVDQTEEVVRTINDNVPQNPLVVKQTVIFGRSVTVDTITGDVISATNWIPQSSSAIWDAYTAKGKDGYEASPATVPAMVVTDNTADVVVNIDYTPVTGLDTAPKPKVPSVPDVQIPSGQSSDKVSEIVVPEAAAASAKPGKVSSAMNLDTKRNNHALLAANKVAKKAALPKTGQQGNGLMVAIGSTFVAVSSLFALAGGKKKNY